MMPRAAAVLALLFSASPAWAQTKKDRVLKHDGTVVEGNVKKDSYKGVEVDSTAIPMEQVKRVEYLDAPPTFVAAVAAIDEGKWEDAIAGLKSAWQRVKEEKDPKQALKPRPWFDQYYLFYMALSERQLGRFDEALGRLKAYREGNKEPSRFWVESFELSLECLREKGDIEGMTTLIASIGAAPPEVQEGLKKRADKQQAELLFDKKEFAKAKSLFDKLRSGSDALLAAEATAGVLRCLEEMKSGDELKRFCQQVLKDEGAPVGIKLIASNAMGRMLAGARDFKSALASFVDSAVRYAPPRGSGFEHDHEEALYQLGQCYREIAGAARDAKKYYLSAASSAFREVVSEYPSGRRREEAIRLAEQTELEASKLK